MDPTWRFRVLRTALRSPLSPPSRLEVDLSLSNLNLPGNHLMHCLRSAQKPWGGGWFCLIASGLGPVWRDGNITSRPICVGVCRLEEQCQQGAQSQLGIPTGRR